MKKNDQLTEMDSGNIQKMAPSKKKLRKIIYLGNKRFKDFESYKKLLTEIRHKYLIKNV